MSMVHTNRLAKSRHPEPRLGRNSHPPFMQFRDVLTSLVEVIANTYMLCLRTRCPGTAAHSERVARLALMVAEELGYPPERRTDLYLMALLHDIGKLGIPDRVLKKEGALNGEEYEEIKDHVLIGVELLAANGLEHLVAGVEGHHERPDALGYPGGVSGDTIPLEARVIACCDAADAMAFPRVYRPEPLAVDRVFATLESGAGSQWDADVVAALVARRADVEELWLASGL